MCKRSRPGLRDRGSSRPAPPRTRPALRGAQRRRKWWRRISLINGWILYNKEMHKNNLRIEFWVWNTGIDVFKCLKFLTAKVAAHQIAMKYICPQTWNIVSQYTAWYNSEQGQCKGWQPESWDKGWQQKLIQYKGWKTDLQDKGWQPNVCH